MIYHRILSIVPCAIQEDLIVYPMHHGSICWPQPPLPSSPNLPPRSVLYAWICFCFLDMFVCVISDSTYKWSPMVFVFLFQTCVIISSCIHGAANGIIPFFFMAEEQSIVHMHRIFFTHSLTDGHSGFFCLCFCKQCCCEHRGACIFLDSFSPDIRPRVESLDHTATLFLVI